MAQTHRFYHPGPFLKGEAVVLDTESSRVVSSVLRLKEGEPCVLMDGLGSLAQVTLQMGRKKEVRGIVDSVDVFNEPRAPLALLQAYLKADKAEWIVQKGTELGIRRFYFFEAQHSVSKINPKYLERFEKIAIEATRQSGNPFLPSISFYTSLEAFFSKLKLSDEHRLWMNETEHTVYFGSHLKTCDKKSAIAAIGPEGGWSKDEILLLRAHDFCSIRLGSYILRSETAALSVAACWNMFSVDGSS